MALKPKGHFNIHNIRSEINKNVPFYNQAFNLIKAYTERYLKTSSHINRTF